MKGTKSTSNVSANIPNSLHIKKKSLNNCKQLKLIIPPDPSDPNQHFSNYFPTLTSRSSAAHCKKGFYPNGLATTKYSDSVLKENLERKNNK